MSNKQELQARVMELINQKFEEISKDLAARLTEDMYREKREVLEHVSQLIAARWVDENYEKVASKIDLETVVKMAQFRAIGKVSSNQ